MHRLTDSDAIKCRAPSIVFCGGLALAGAFCPSVFRSPPAGGGEVSTELPKHSVDRALRTWRRKRSLARVHRIGPRWPIVVGFLVLLEWLAWSPGPIDVRRFAASAQLDEQEIDQLTVSFRRRLADLRIQAPSTVLGAVPQGDFLDALAQGGVRLSQRWGNAADVTTRRPRAASRDVAMVYRSTSYG
jgi:hypothetical protein